MTRGLALRELRRIISIALVCAPGIFGLAGSADAAQGDTVLVSRAGGFGAVGNRDSSSASVSADGRYVAFESDATSLHPDASSGLTTDIFVRDRVSNTITLVSRKSGAAGEPGDSSSSSPAISADGRYVAFSSLAGNLDADSDDAVRDVFVRDLVAHTTTLVSRADGVAGAVGDSYSDGPSISADGRLVAFDSTAGNLDPDSTSGNYDVYVRDLASNTTTLVSRASGAAGIEGEAGNEWSFGSSMSADGRSVAFRSYATNLHPDSSLGAGSVDLFVRTLASNATTLVSRATGEAGAVGNASSYGPTLSADGRYIAFYSSATNLDAGSAGVFVRDLVLNTTTLVSRANGATGVAGDGQSFEPSMSADGRYVAFTSDATNLDPDSYDAVRDIFVRDLVLNTTTLVSRASGATGAVSDAQSLRPSISADGRYVAFDSGADNLDPDSDDSHLDVFMRDLLGPQAPPALEIGDIALKEGKAATTTAFTFTVTLDGVSGRTVTVDYATKNGTATLGDNDYVFTNGTLMFLPGETTKQITVTVNGDKKKETTEMFKVYLFDAAGAELGDGTGLGTIKNDDR